jgi:hypothetical protein
MREYVHDAVKVGIEPVRVCAVGQFVEQCLLCNTGDVVVYVGGSTVTAETGFPVDPGERIELKSYQDDAIEVWAVVGALKAKSNGVTHGGETTRERDHHGTLRFLVSS